ncbi:MAG: hypothetical protein AB9873_00225 [Syntrophobacteraceae bacterium]
MKLHRRNVLISIFMIMVIGVTPVVVLAQAQEEESYPDVSAQRESRTVSIPEHLEVAIDWAIQLNAPYQVQRFAVSSPDSTTLKVSIADTDPGGDRWKATVQIWDERPSTRTTTCSGVSGAYSTPVTMSNNGKLPLRARVEVRYSKGNNAFPAGAVLRMEGNGSMITATNLGVSDF